jgi:LysM repeat protein
MESDPTHRSPLRLLAPIALVVFGVVLLLVIAGGGGGSGDSAGSADKAAEKRDLGSTSSERKQRRKHRTNTTTTKEPTGDVYVVKQGDTLAGIAETTGVSVDRLQELNPGLDQFSLVAGQRIKLR